MQVLNAASILALLSIVATPLAALAASTYSTDGSEFVVEQSKDGRTLKVAEQKTPTLTRRILQVNPAAERFQVNPAAERGFEASAAANDEHAYTLIFSLSNNQKVIVKTHPVTYECSIKTVGPQKSISEDDQKYLKNLQEALIADSSIDIDNVGSMMTQSERAAGLLSEWPETYDLDFVCDFDAEQERLANQPPHNHIIAGTQGSPRVPGGNKVRRVAHVLDEDEEGRNQRRRLAYTSLCSYVNSYYEVTHDGFFENNWDDDTTFYAYLSMHASGPCDDGTYFWTGSQWSCYEPDHDTDVEYAYGDCFGRCGSGCGSNTQFTLDCANHDSCVRFGHIQISFWCDDEFSYTIDDALYAPNC